MTPGPDIERLIEVMAALRNPDSGCPWDIEQDFASIIPYTLEEAYEVADAIEREDVVDLQEELGDLLLQVVYHSQMASEREWFTFADVVYGISQKMIRRHPHVFGDKAARSAGMAKGMWEAIKAEEKAERRAAKAATANTGQEQQSCLDDVPATLPAMTTALKLQKKASRVGFDWQDPAPILDKIEEELQEFQQTLVNDNQAFMEAEFGDLLFALINLGRHYDLDPEMALRATNAKFRKRFAHIEAQLKTDDIELGKADLDLMEKYWQEAKSLP